MSNSANTQKIVVQTKQQAKAEKMAKTTVISLLPVSFLDELVSNQTTLNAIQSSVPVFISNYFLTLQPQNKPDYINNMKKIVDKLDKTQDIITFSKTKNNCVGVPVIESYANSIKMNLSEKVINSIERQKLKVAIEDWKSDALIKAPTTACKEDAWVAQKYTAKQVDCASRGIKMELTFNQMKRLLKRKYCYYSGVELKENTCHRVTLDRKDCTKGYTVDNTVACSFAVNQCKNSLLESKEFFEGSRLTDENIKKMLTSFVKVM